jgi:putative transcriptional regulator
VSINKPQQRQLKILGEKIKTIRKSKGLTLKQLSYLTDKEPQSIHRVEQGQTNPTLLYLLKICEGLDIDIIELLKDLGK